MPDNTLNTTSSASMVDLVNATKGVALNTGALVKAFNGLSTSIDQTVGGLKGFGGTITLTMIGTPATYVISDMRITATNIISLQPQTFNASSLYPFMKITKVAGSITLTYPNNGNADCIFDYVIFLF